MSFQERTTIIGLIVSLCVIYFLTTTMYVPLRAEQGAELGGLSGQAYLLFKIILGAIIGSIVLTIVSVIVQAIVTGDEDPSTLVDERDRAIEVYGDRIGYGITGAFFMYGVAGLAFLGWDASWFLLVMAYGFSIGSLVGCVLRLVRHFRGY